MSPQSATADEQFATAAVLALEEAFGGGRLTSDGGLPRLAWAAAATGVCAVVVACAPKSGDAHIRHSIGTPVRQRVFRAGCSYNDWNAADILRGDPSGTRCWYACPARRASRRGQARCVLPTAG